MSNFVKTTTNSVSIGGLGSSAYVSGSLSIRDTTSSFNPISGALTVCGGVGIIQNLYVGGGIYMGQYPIPTTLAVANMVATSLSVYTNTTGMNTAISNATINMDTITLRNTALSSYTTTTGMTSAIGNVVIPYTTTVGMTSAIGNVVIPYTTTAGMNTAISNATLNMDTITLRNTALTSYSSLSGNNTFTGVFTTTQTSDILVPAIFSTTPSFSMTNGMVYNLTSNSTALSSLGFTNISTTPQQTYVFSFIILPSTSSSPWYLKPPTNYISVTAISGSINTSVPVYGISNVSFPPSYTYIMQQITIVNTSLNSTPSFIAFLSTSAY